MEHNANQINVYDYGFTDEIPSGKGKNSRENKQPNNGQQVLSRCGHRHRMREMFLNGETENAPDHNLLELFISLIIPQKDVKQLSYDLINRFGSLKGVFAAEPAELMKTDGVGEVLATGIKMVSTLNKRIATHENDDVTNLSSAQEAKRYCRNLLKQENYEKILVISLSNDGKIINHHLLGGGTVNNFSFNSRKILECAVRDNASAVLLSHNHPDGSAKPSANDFNCTLELSDIFFRVGIKLVDHIIVGSNDTFSFAEETGLLNKK